MPKKILHESAIHQLLWAARRLRAQLAPAPAAALDRWLGSLQFDDSVSGELGVAWTAPAAGRATLALRDARFYTRGDAPAHVRRQTEAGFVVADDPVMAANCRFFDRELRTLLATAQIEVDAAAATAPEDRQRKEAEEHFHDEWAASEDPTQIDVRRRNEACTAPEMRHLRTALGPLAGRTLLDVGCGLGEASVYFALEGATVTATDISPGMCEITSRLAQANGVALETHVSAIEDLGLGNRQFDIIYTGNTLHHADIAATLDNILPHLKPDGVFLSWDPVAYNPIINVYRALATKVRTPDEHPLRLRDIRMVTSRFARTEVRWFWFTTLLVFILMAVVQFRNPNKERYWKKVVDEADSWAWLYRPLAALDRGLLCVLPFLRPLCWNVVIVGRGPIVAKS